MESVQLIQNELYLYLFPVVINDEKFMYVTDLHKLIHDNKARVNWRNGRLSCSSYSANIAWMQHNFSILSKIKTCKVAFLGKTCHEQSIGITFKSGLWCGNLNTTIINWNKWQEPGCRQIIGAYFWHSSTTTAEQLPSSWQLCVVLYG